MKKRLIRLMLFLLIIPALIAVALIVFLNHPSFGRLPRGERLERIKMSAHYHEGKFRNNSPTEVMASDKSKAASLIDFIFRKIPDLRPEQDLPVVKTDLKSLPQDQDILVWLGHSSCFIRLREISYLVDPALVTAAPVSFVNKPFPGSSPYSPDDLPDIDYLIITHDHWDHLDYETVMPLKERIRHVVCALGVGEHFESWGFPAEKIIELDWNEEIKIAADTSIHCLPSRHFSGRGLKADQTLWASFMISSHGYHLYLSGDTGYDTHFAEIAARFPRIDLALMENGQYNEDWKSIHLLPENLVKAVKELNPARLMTIHHSKYALSKHSWHAPLDHISNSAEQDSLNLVTPKIGEPVYLAQPDQSFEKWWLPRDE